MNQATLSGSRVPGYIYKLSDTAYNDFWYSYSRIVSGTKCTWTYFQDTTSKINVNSLIILCASEALILFLVSNIKLKSSIGDAIRFRSYNWSRLQRVR